ncbi:MAG: M50 family metallopeptidase [Verrucomicrobiae bacterium]|nr:M50 family metallopeptidase [Verrucomicrobiae bacterium]
MFPTGEGSIRLFRVGGIQVYLHWSWFLVAVFELTTRREVYGSLAWNAAEYLALFGIVLLHEFGHALACRSVGGRAEQIVLWPLGGVAYVQPPERPGAVLWSIAAGPLVNVVLFTVLTAWSVFVWPDLESVPREWWLFWRSLWIINVVLLVFNLLPIYPLDGGQILRALLWFALGRARSLQVAAGIGLVGTALLALGAIWLRSVWAGLVVAFIGLNCWAGWKHARWLMQMERENAWLRVETSRD